MFKVTVSNDEKPEFQPFTLNIRLTSRETACNLFNLLKPIVYARAHSHPGFDVSPASIEHVNEEQQKLAQGICNILSSNVHNIEGE